MYAQGLIPVLYCPADFPVVPLLGVDSWTLPRVARKAATPSENAAHLARSRHPFPQRAMASRASAVPQKRL